MIYAHVGLFRQTGFGVDYQQNTTEVFERFAQHYDRVHRGLGILGYLEDSELIPRQPGLASWAPDWTTKSMHPPLRFESLHGCKVWLLPTSSKYQFIQLPNLMCTPAYTVLSIVGISNTIDDMAPGDSVGDLLSPDQWADSRYTCWVRHLGPKQKVLSIFLGELTFGSPFETLRTDFSGLIAKGRPHKRYTVCEELLLKRKETASIVNGRKVAHVIGFKGHGIIYEASLMTWLALVPAIAQAGDQICLIPGCAFAFVIREGDSTSYRKVYDRMRNALFELSGSRRRVRLVRMIGECFSHIFSSPPRKSLGPDLEELIAIH
jgi:hypothetical protein